MRVMIGETKGRAGDCDHVHHAPRYADSAFEGLSVETVRQRFPRWQGICTICNRQGVLYASKAHYDASDGAHQDAKVPTLDPAED